MKYLIDKADSERIILAEASYLEGNSLDSDTYAEIIKSLDWK